MELHKNIRNLLKLLIYYAFVLNMIMKIIELKSDPPEYCSTFYKMNKIMKTNKLEIIFFILFIGLIAILVIMMLV